MADNIMTTPDPIEFGIKLEMLHGDIGEIKTALGRLSDAIVKLALIEERQTVANSALERAFVALERVEMRVNSLERANVNTSRTSVWLDRFVIAGVGVLLILVLKNMTIL